jgi:Tfp pilus assembly protein PilO
MDYRWHLDRRVPLALLFGLSLQVVAFVWWVSGISHDMAQVKTNMSSLTEDLKIKATAINEIIALKAEQRHILATLERLERAVERLSPPQRSGYHAPARPRPIP